MFRVTMPETDLGKIADSGQCFRLNRMGEGIYSLIAKGRWLQITEAGNGEFIFSCDESEFNSIWRPYFDLDTDYSRYCLAVPESDEFMQGAIRSGQGIRILRQDPWEMLITFIISQRKNIPAIRRCVESLCSNFGSRIEGAPQDAFSFPPPDILAEQTSDTLAPCSLGYRAPYVLAAAGMVSRGEIDLQGLQNASDCELYTALTSVPGVGAKVAGCVMLFGYHRLDAFPRDVWINRTIEREYGGCFDEARYSGFRGVIQQYMFYHARTIA